MDRRSHRFAVLVGDDDVAVRESVRELLADRDFDVVTAARGEDALRTLLSRPIDFSILDVELPDMTGLDVIRAYLEGPWIVGLAEPPRREVRRRMPTIFMSGNPAVEIRTAAALLGVTFLDKPFGAHDLRSAVDRILTDFLT